MKIGFIFLFVCLGLCAQAQNENMRVTIIDDNIKKTDFPRDIKFDSHKRKMSVRRLDRDTQFEKLKLTTYVEKLKMDELDRDLLYMALKNNSIAEIIKSYPKIPPQVLTDAKNNFIK